ncbi:Lrp/AsnC family transcriptional regulator [Methanolobus halotolerans]|uniref:Lrp/AsnC family transcriptional regulator n=1 Tax=Methanolobus halotolerans TaxID=2052935 RepID=A0A4E0PY16_9EURY|nr:Lrp/AsnC family transcriptional regulator [Methanolobus halotolerans]TGC08364.1 Lrp/AsnC family transcriptional regulator [Methanolobus halotolerans]
MDGKTRHILECLEADAKISHEKVATLTGIPVEDVSRMVGEMENNGVIRKYKTVIDWDLAGDENVYAIIELKVSLERRLGYQALVERLYKFPEVRSVRLLSGQYDLSLTVSGRSMKEVAFFVAEKISTLDQVQHTTTHFVLKTYKEDGVILHEQDHVARLPVTP